MNSDTGDFIRDEGSNALINTNINAFNQYKQQRASLIKLKEQEQTISNLKDEISQMKQMLQELIREKNG